MEEQPLEGAEQTQSEALHQNPMTESQITMSNFGVQGGSILQQVAQGASKAAEQLGGFKIYEEENELQDQPGHSLKGIPEQNLPQVPEHGATIPTTLETPTTSLAAIAGDSTIEGNASYGANIDGGSCKGSPPNEASYTMKTEQHQIQAFAKLEFDDGDFYMQTYTVEIGRDIHEARQVAELQARQDTETKSGKQSISAGDSIPSRRTRHRKGQRLRNSIAGDSGGLLAIEQSVHRKKSRSRKYKSKTSSPQELSRRSSMLLSNGKKDYNALALDSLDPNDLVENYIFPFDVPPDPVLVPLLPVHPPALSEGTLISGKSISRKHIRIAYNFEDGLFEVEILGRNGVFVDDQWYAQGEISILKNGSMIQMGGVEIRFVLPDVGPGETGAETGLETDPLSGGTGSFDMEGSNGNESYEDVDEDKKDPRPLYTKDEEGSGDEIEGEEEEEEEEEAGAEESGIVKIRVKGGKGKKKPEPEPLPVTKRKGPGRPPKNGIISKREQALLARQAREKAKAAADRDLGAPHDRGKPKAGQSTKAVKQEKPLVQAIGKRKYTKRKRAGGLDDQKAIRESTEQTDSVPPEKSIAAKLPPKPAKQKKRPKPPRSPSPVYDEATLTPEQLAKPVQNYIVLIHEALSNSETGTMALPQIYRSLQRRYPYFKLRATTVGWQSSVRHNLTQNEAFRKIEREGKGWMWGLVPGVSIERERKRKASPPPVPQRPYYPPGPPPMQYPFPYAGMLPPNGHVPPHPYGMPPGMPPAPMPHGLPPRGRLGFQIPLSNASESTYQSPYQSTPPPPPPPQQNSATNGANGHYPTPTSQPPSQAPDRTYQTSGPAPSPSPASHQPQRESLTDSVLPESKAPPSEPSNPRSTTDTDVASSYPASSSTSAKTKVRSPLRNGDASGRDGLVENEAPKDKGGGKRPLEEGYSDGTTTDRGQPEAKRLTLQHR